MKMSQNQPARAKRKPARPKHVPLRTCVVCRSKDAKRGFVRIVRSPEGKVFIDPSGKANGRGAYLCTNPDCWQRAAASPILERALKTDIGPEFRAELRRYADEHFRATDIAPGDAEERLPEE